MLGSISLHKALDIKHLNRLLFLTKLDSSRMKHDSLFCLFLHDSWADFRRRQIRSLIHESPIRELLGVVLAQALTLTSLPTLWTVHGLILLLLIIP